MTASSAAEQQRQDWWRSPPRQPSPELLAIALVYLVQGLLGLSRLAVFTFLKDNLGLAPASVALITSSGYAPWVSAPLGGSSTVSCCVASLPCTSCAVCLPVCLCPPLRR